MRMYCSGSGLSALRRNNTRGVLGLLLSVWMSCTWAGDVQLFTVATYNTHLFFDAYDDPKTRDMVLGQQAFARKLQQLALYVTQVLDCPDVLAVQEVENKATLQRLGDVACQQEGGYHALLIEGNDFVGMDVGFLVKRRLIIHSLSQLADRVRISQSKHVLFDHPPLFLQLSTQVQGQSITMVLVHNRSFKGLENPRQRQFVERKRMQQAQWLGAWVGQWLRNHPGGKLIILGDFNAVNESESVRLIKNATAKRPEQGLIDVGLSIPVAERYSYVYKQTGQALDHMLVSSTLAVAVLKARYTRVNARRSKQMPVDAHQFNALSDHDGLVVSFDRAVCCNRVR
jgi:predicted extracellular nuclease